MMTDQEALLKWLRIAWRKGQLTERLAEQVRHGMTVSEAVRIHESPWQEVNDLLLSWGDKGKLRLPL